MTEVTPSGGAQTWDDVDWNPDSWTAETWPIATCLHGIPPVGRDGVALHDAAPEVWDDMFAQVEQVGFTLAELADSHVRPCRSRARGATSSSASRSRTASASPRCTCSARA